MKLSIKLGEDQSLQKLNVPFVVNTERANQTILGLNAIKMLVQLNDNFNVWHEMIYQSVVKTILEHLLT